MFVVTGVPLRFTPAYALVVPTGLRVCSLPVVEVPVHEVEAHGLLTIGFLLLLVFQAEQFPLPLQLRYGRGVIHCRDFSPTKVHIFLTPPSHTTISDNWDNMIDNHNNIFIIRFIRAYM